MESRNVCPTKYHLSRDLKEVREQQSNENPEAQIYLSYFMSMSSQ